jgi:RimJ/RimL family protein N-acetyltransferase
VSLRPASPAESAALAAFLAAHIDSAMFLAASLHRHGVESAAPQALRFWRTGEGAVTGVIGLAPAGFAAVLMPEGVPGPALRAAFAGRRLLGISGPPAQVAAVRAALGVAQGVPAARGLEPLFRLALADLVLPEGDTRLRPAVAADLDLLALWRHGFRSEIDGFPADPEAARADVERGIVGGTLRVLESAEGAVAMTGFNAVLPDRVQVGSVYTPPALRGRGHARRAVALHLAEARAAGVVAAGLFAASEAAVRAYEAIGFRQIGMFHLLQFDRPEVVAA